MSVRPGLVAGLVLGGLSLVLPGRMVPGGLSQPAPSSPAPSNPAPSDTVLTPTPVPLDLKLLQASANPPEQPGYCASPMSVVTATTPCQYQPVVPSLWWAKQQYGERILNNWLAYPPRDRDPGRVDLVVNEQAWSVLNYLERYQFVNKLGTVIRGYGYNTRIFSRQGDLVAAYTCAFPGNPSENIPCSIYFDPLGREGLRGRSNPGTVPIQ